MQNLINKKEQALARATEVYIAIDIIDKYSEIVSEIVSNHSPSEKDNNARRDCETFWNRLEELLLKTRALKIHNKGI